MNTILVGTDSTGQSIQKGDKIIADDGMLQGEIKAVWDNGTVDVRNANAHQGPVIDSIDIVGRNVIKI